MIAGAEPVAAAGEVPVRGLIVVQGEIVVFRPLLVPGGQPAWAGRLVCGEGGGDGQSEVAACTGERRGGVGASANSLRRLAAFSSEIARLVTACALLYSMLALTSFDMRLASDFWASLASSSFCMQRSVTC